MSEYICDDRIDYVELGNRINNMTEEEFKLYCEELKKKELDNYNVFKAP